MTSLLTEPSLTASVDLYNPRGPAAPIAYFGGKAAQAEWIINYLPDHRVYVEPFGGMGNVLLQKVPSKIEIFNDLDARIVNLFDVIRSPEKLAELQRLCHLTPHSRELYAQLCADPESEDEVERAYKFFTLARMSRGGLGLGQISANGWAMSDRDRRGMPEPVSKYLSAVDGLSEVAARLRHVVLENKPAIELIRKYDGPDVVMYLDPPYPGSVRSGGKAATYRHEMSDAEHIELLEVLLTCESNVLLSGYASPMYDELLIGWHRLEKPMKVQVSNSGQTRIEVLWMNFPSVD